MHGPKYKPKYKERLAVKDQSEQNYLKGAGEQPEMFSTGGTAWRRTI